MPSKSKKKMAGRGPRRGGGGANQEQNRGPVFVGGSGLTNFLARNLMGTNQSRRGTLAWGNSGSFSLTLGDYNESVATLNNPYDPDPTLGGESATGFAKWMAFFSKCFVTRARWRADYAVLLQTSGLAPNVAPTYVGATVTTNSSSLAGFTAAVTNGLSQFRLLAQNPDTCKFEGIVDIGRFLNKPQVLDDPDLFCTASASPAQIICLHSWAENTSANSTVLYSIIVEFDCVFTDPVVFT